MHLRRFIFLPAFSALACFVFAFTCARGADLTPGPVIGIGAVIEAVKAQPTVVSVVSGSPASQNGIRPGDRIVSIDGTKVDGMEIHRVAALLHGAENSRVHLTVDRHGRQLDFSMRRKILTVGPTHQ